MYSKDMCLDSIFLYRKFRTNSIQIVLSMHNLRLLTPTFNNKLTKAMGISDHNRRKRIHCSNMILYWQAEPFLSFKCKPIKNQKRLGAELYKGEKSRSGIYSIIINGCETRTIIRTMNHWVAKDCNNL